MTVDVITKCEQDTGIVAEVFTNLSNTPGTASDDYRLQSNIFLFLFLSLDVTVSDAQESPVIVFARLMKAGLPVLEAAVTVEVYLPGEFPHASVGDNTRYQLQLRDDGLGK